MERRKSGRILLTYLVYFLIILLVPVLTMTVIYWRVADIVTINACEQNLAAMKSSAQTISQNLDDLENLSYNITQNSQMTRFFNLVKLDKDGTIVSTVYETGKDLRYFTIANNMIAGIQIYSANADFLIDSRTSSMSLDRYYGAVFSVEGMTLEQWRETFLNGSFQSAIFPARTISDGGSARRRITFVQSVPFSATHRTTGNIFIYMDEAELLRLFEPIPYRNGGMLTVLNGAGEAVIRDNANDADTAAFLESLSEPEGYEIREINGLDQLVIHYYDSRYQWRYVAAIPHSQVIASTNEIRNFLLIMILITLAGGVLLAVVYAYKASRPVVSAYRQLANLVSGRRLAPNDLGDEIGVLVRRNTDLKALADLRLPAHQAALVYSLLSGDFRDEEDLRASFGKLGIALDGERYAVLVAVLTDLDTGLSFQEISVYKEAVKELLRDGFLGGIGVFDMDFERVALLADASGREEAVREALSRSAGEVTERALKDVGISLYFAAGLADRLTEIPAAFSAVQAAVRLAVYGSGQHIRWCGAEEGEKAYYPDNLESRLILAVKEGKTPVLFDSMASLERHNVRGLTEGSRMGYELVQLLYATLLRVATDLPPGNDGFLQRCSSIAYDISRQELAPREIFTRLTEAFAAAAALNAEADLSSNALRARILEYVDANFRDPQISLASVADNFNITEVYLSRVFKQITGENFSRHIEKLRMDCANKLMEEGRHRISEISVMVGYNSPQVFRRAYKRCFGMLPSEFGREK